jgi:hypothetical protein
MAQNMAVSVTLRLQDEFSRPIRQLMQNMQDLTRRAQESGRALGGTGSANTLGRLQQQVRGINNDVRQLASSFQQLGRAMSTSSGGTGFGQRMIRDLRQVLQMQQQIIANNNRMASVPGPPGSPSGPRGPGIFGRSGFNPNASIPDRMQYRAVHTMEQSLITGALDLDRARTNLLMLANPRRDPNNPDQLLPGVISPETVAQIEVEAVGLTQQFRALNRAHVLDTFKELVTQFQSPDSAFKLLPQLLAVQEWQILQGSTVDQAREGMARLVRAMGLSGRLVDNNGQLNEAESGEFLLNYLRARIIGGVDVTPDQVFQVMKYLKTTGQTLSQDALLTAFIGMPDIRGSTFGVQLNQLRSQLTGRATKEALAAQQAAGLITGGMQQTTPGGPNKFVRTGTVDEEMLNTNPFEWFNKHILVRTAFCDDRA